MGYERAKFGDGSASGSGNVTTAVNNHYGPRDTGKTVGTFYTNGVERELSMDIDAEMLSNDAFALLPPLLPAGAVVLECYADVTEAFDVGTGTLSVGTEGSEATNGVDVSEAQLEAVGVYDITSTVAGTWANPLAAETTVGLVWSSTVADLDVGKVRVVVRYVQY